MNRPTAYFDPFMLAAVEGYAATGAKGHALVAAGDDEPDPDWQPL
ncbi:hypothetical protein [Dyella sp. A6]|nr:hypothetical protein [Dyella sp. A6]